MEEKKNMIDDEVKSAGENEKAGESEVKPSEKKTEKESTSEKKTINPKIIIIAAAIVVVLIILAIILFGGKKNGGGTSSDEGQSENGGANGSGGNGGNGGNGGEVEEEDSYTKELFFELNRDGNYVVSIGDADQKSKIIIPEEYNGRPVVAIAAGGFYECDNIVSITIPSTITEIGNAAFYNCVRLVEVINHSSLEIIKGDNLQGFAGFYALEVHDGEESKLVNKDGIYFYSADDVNYVVGCERDITSLVLPEKYNGEEYKIHDYAFYKHYSIENLSIPDSIKEIGSYAFSYCKSLKSVVIPDSVVLVGEYAFSACSSLKTAVIGNGISEISCAMFASCYLLDSVTLGSNVTKIGSNAFNTCVSLMSITLPEKLTSIEEASFYECTKLVEIINKSSMDIKRNDYYLSQHGYLTQRAQLIHNGESKLVNQDGFIFFTNDYNENYLVGYEKDAVELTLPDYYNGQEYYVHSYAFSNCPSLTSIVVSKGVKRINSFAFNFCPHLVEVINKSSLSIGSDIASNILEVHYEDSKLVNKDGFLFYRNEFTATNYLVGYIGDETTITLPDNFNGESYKIHDVAFESKYLIESITIPSGVTAIGESAFWGCYSLRSITIGSDVDSIGNDAFYGCTALRYVNLTDLAKWCNISFKNSTSNPLYLNGRLYIDNQLVEELVIPEGVTSIGKYAFYNCDSITSIVFSKTLTDIDRSAFTNVGYIKTLTIPDNVTYIGYYAFEGCASLETLYIGNGITTINRDAFSSCNSLVSITLGENVQSVDRSAFSYCYNLREVINKSSVSTASLGFKENVITHNGESRLVEVNGYYFYTVNGINYLACYVGLNPMLVLPDNFNGESYEILDGAFYSSYTLTAIVIPECVTKIGDSAFHGCGGMENVYFTGSEEAWNNISIGSDNWGIEKSTIHFNYVP